MCASFSICCNCCCCFHLLRSHVFLPYLFDSLWFTIQIAASFLQTLWMFWPLWKLQTWVLLIEYTSIFFANVLGTFFFLIFIAPMTFFDRLCRNLHDLCAGFFSLLFSFSFLFFRFPNRGSSQNQIHQLHKHICENIIELCSFGLLVIFPMHLFLIGLL